MELVAAQPLTEGGHGEPDRCVMTRCHGCDGDARPIGEPRPPEREPGEVVEEVPEHRAPPIEHSAHLVVHDEDVEVQKIGVDEVPALWTSCHQRRHPLEDLVERGRSDRRRGQRSAPAWPEPGGPIDRDIQERLSPCRMRRPALARPDSVASILRERDHPGRVEDRQERGHRASHGVLFELVEVASGTPLTDRIEASERFAYLDQTGDRNARRDDARCEAVLLEVLAEPAEADDVCGPSTLEGERARPLALPSDRRDVVNVAAEALEEEAAGVRLGDGVVDRGAS